MTTVLGDDEPRGSRISGKLLCSHVNEAADDASDPLGDGSSEGDAESEADGLIDSDSDDAEEVGLSGELLIANV